MPNFFDYMFDFDNLDELAQDLKRIFEELATVMAQAIEAERFYKKPSYKHYNKNDYRLKSYNPSIPKRKILYQYRRVS